MNITKFWEVVLVKKLSNEILIDTYLQAVLYQLEVDFIEMLALELRLRGLQLPEHQYSA